MKRRVYIFNGASRAAVYGIGTYIEQLVHCLKNTINFEVIYIHADSNELSFSSENGYNQITIPQVPFTIKQAKYYYRNIAYLLKDYIAEDEDVLNIFHLNFMTNPLLVDYLKKMFKCKVILVSHYTNWSFSLLGNEKAVKEILNKKKTKLTVSEKEILKDINEDKKMMEKCDKVVFVAQHTRDFFQHTAHANIQHSQIIHNALKDSYKPLSETEKIQIKKKYFLPEHSPIIIFAGRLDEVKGISFLLKAFRNVLNTNLDAHLLIAGEGDFNKWISEINDCWTKVSFTGRLDKKKLYELYNIANLGVICSTHEEFGFVAIEMMMHGLPIIASNTGGLAEIIEDTISGLKIPIRNKKGVRGIDTKLLTEKIEYVLNNPAVATELGSNARKRFLENYEINLFKKKMIQLYNLE
ncbi:TIGR04157 family glycosyltransferase [Bacteroides sp. 519]|uniref:TIGR04157 family glycosyltransferase n=1 Tax=Bacteroides sp. 519 TaxID=2302937 RepID=UPI0013D1FEB1|nr:TIGR04157 family glycosyltransferase [Bacteroides sp. 519]NDV57808.1 TIGR04157 family glycosyltransferase [Bacteroides sp. 519]